MKTASGGRTASGIAVLALPPYALLPVLPEGIARTLLSEDSMVEWVGALAWLAASVVFVIMLQSRRPAGTSTALDKLWLAFFDVRESVDGERKSGLVRWLTFNRVSSLIWMGYLVALPILVWLVAPARSLATRSGPPVPPLRVALAAAVNYAAFFALITSLSSPDTDQRLLNVGANEIKESVIAVLFAWTAFACSRIP